MRGKLTLDVPILDYGSGDGHVANKQFDKYPSGDVYLSDVVNNVSLEVRNKYYNFLDIDKESSKINFISDNYFSSATCIHVLEHVTCANNVMTELNRVLKPKGKLYLETPNPRSLFVPSLSPNRTWNFYDDYTHVRPYTANALEKIAEDYGFTVLQSGIYRTWKYALSLPLAPLISVVLRDWRPLHYAIIHAVGWSSYCLCEKNEEV